MIVWHDCLKLLIYFLHSHHSFIHSTMLQMIEQLKTDTEAYGEDLRRKEMARTRAHEEVAQREAEVTGLQKSTAELESKLRMQQVMVMGNVGIKGGGKG